ncbi:unnamed protein product, partial [Ectocarpus sp. 12 AP-2014]
MGEQELEHGLPRIRRKPRNVVGRKDVPKCNSMRDGELSAAELFHASPGKMSIRVILIVKNDVPGLHLQWAGQERCIARYAFVHVGFGSSRCSVFITTAQHHREVRSSRLLPPLLFRRGCGNQDSPRRAATAIGEGQQQDDGERARDNAA